MTEEELLRARKVYKETMDKKEEYKRAKSRLEELVKIPEVQEYMDLSKVYYQIQNGLPLEKVALKGFEKESISTRSSNNILVYMGQYDENGYLRSYEGGNWDYVLYRDLENFKQYEILSDEREEFESKHNVVYLDSIKYDEYLSFEVAIETSFRELRSKFFNELTNYSQEEAKEKILKRK